MNNELINNNRVYLMGTISTEAKFSHEIYGEGFYDMSLCVTRLSEQCDEIPITVSERIIQSQNLCVGSRIALIGQFRSYNKLVEGKSKLMLTVFVREIIEPRYDLNSNIIELVGFICKEPIYRTTPFKREICDLLLAVNRAYNKSDYLPCIAWGRNARFVNEIGVGQKIYITGRIQSRQYQKRLDEDSSETRVAYEVSIGKVSLDDKIERVLLTTAEQGILTSYDLNPSTNNFATN
ncbi:MAG: single-stranded DNA-binding protein [Firmicutes bacterium]|nr:single-stranded DNA-binding protein [Bacillota bacterium]